MTGVDLKINRTDVGAYYETFNVTIQIPGLTYAHVVEKVKALGTHDVYDYDETTDAEWTSLDARDHRDCWIAVENNDGTAKINFNGYYTLDDPDDRLDGSFRATELSLDDRLLIASTIKRIIAE